MANFVPFILEHPVHCVPKNVPHVVSYNFVKPWTNWWQWWKNRLQFIIVKAIRYGYLPRSFSTLNELREDSDDKLFFSAKYNPNHVLRRLLPQPKSIEHNLRQRTHNLTLPMDVNAAMKQNFVYRILFSDIY